MTLNQADFGPTNVDYGNVALFTIQFLDEDNLLTVPSAATLSVTYINRDEAEQTDNLPMTINNRGLFSCAWASGDAALGLAVWVARSAGHSSAAQLGLLRITDFTDTIVVFPPEPVTPIVPIPPPVVISDAYTAEDGTTFYVAEDGTTYYFQET